MTGIINSLAVRARWALTAAVAAISLAVTAIALALSATPAAASTIAYVSGDSVYVANADGTGAVKVEEGGVTSPTLDTNGDLFMLTPDGTTLEKFTPGAIGNALIPLPSNESPATQVAVSPDESKFAVTDGTFLSDVTTTNILNSSTRTSKTLPKGALSPYWVNNQKLAFSIPSVGVTRFTRAAVYNGLFSRPAFFADAGVKAPFTSLVVEYAPNPQHTEAAAVVYEIGPSLFAENLIVFPINTRTLAPTGNPAAAFYNGGAGVCNVSNDYLPAPAPTVAWSPDGSSLAFFGSNDAGNTEGIEEAPIGAWSSDCSQVGSAQMVIPGGTQPSWGLSDNRDFTPAP